MDMKLLAVTLGLGAAAGAVAIMMAPHQCTARKLAYKAASKVEDAASQMVERVHQKIDHMQ